MNTVILDDAVVKILIAKSKTDQMGKGRWISIPADVNIFVASTVMPGTIFVFKKCSSHLGLQQYKFTSYSFWIGATSEAARSRVSEKCIKKIWVGGSPIA